MGAIRLGVDQNLVREFRDRYNIRVFIETGTYKGGTCSWAAGEFEQVYTIEGYRKRFEKTAAALAGKYDNLTMISGDSREELRRVLNSLREPVLFWLDAHWCGDGAEEAYRAGDECPLREELKAINNHDWARYHVIMIDDARLFKAPPPYPHDPKQWPTFSTVERLLYKWPRKVRVLDDVIYAEPVSDGFGYGFQVNLSDYPEGTGK